MSGGRKGDCGGDVLRCRLIRWALIFAVVGISQAASAVTVKSYIRNREGVGSFNRKNYFQAYQKFLKAMEDDPLSPELQMNIGRTFEENEEWPKAEQAYHAALKLLPATSPLRFEAWFNLAGALAKQKKIDEALAAYQEALAIDPESIEVKTNIELLFQGGGGGGGDSKDQNQQQQQQQGGQGQNQEQQPQDQQQQKKPKSFQSQELSQDDVKRILDEIKNQEQNIRAQDYEKGAREMPKAKDW